MSYLLALLLLPALRWGINFGIKRGLTATREVETAVPANLPWREVRIPSANQKQLFGWFIPAQAGAPVLLVMHGWGGNAQMMLPLAAPLHEAGYAVLFLDARCHGQSDEDSFTSLPRFAEDIEHGIAWLKQQPETRGVALGVIGHSVGAGAALLAATRNPAIALVVSLAAFAHPAAMMRRWLRFKRIPYWPLGAYILAYVQRVIGFRFDEIAPLNTINRVLCPVLLVHGLDDETVPASEAEVIFSRRSHERVELLLIPGSHDQYADLDRHLPTLRNFMARAFAAS